nr:PKD domain-containing protein [Flavobacterium selenitireducens]
MPQASFDVPNGACTGNTVCLNNTSAGNQILGGQCSGPAGVWNISPSTGFTLSAGSNLGNDFGSIDPGEWLPGSANLCLIFNLPGTYTLTLKIANKCGIDTEVKTICVSAPLLPQFTLNTNTGCAPLSVSATNTTNLTSVCGTATNTWSVVHTSGFCGTSTVNIPSQTSTNAGFNFTEPGTYTIRLTTTNSCGSTFVDQSVTVKKPPTASINTVSNLCGSGTITPQAVVASCSTTAISALNYNWSFPGGTPSSSTAQNPGPISYSTSGNYTISLTVSNECGSSTTATQSFSVSASPTITNSSLNQTICSGTSTAAINLASSLPNTTYSWTGTQSSGVTGAQLSGTSAIIPAQTLMYSGTGTGTLTYVVTPSTAGCLGTPVTIVITVTPAPTITSQPQPQTLCQDGTANPLGFQINAGSATPTYQWFSNISNSNTGGNPISGQTNSTFTPPTTAAGTVYYYVIASLGSGGCSALTSAVAQITVHPLPQVSAQPIASQTICVGGTVSALTASVSGGTGTPAYQWYSNGTNSNSGGNPIPGATSAAFTPSNFNAAGDHYYYLVATFSGVGCGNATSQVAHVEVLPDPTFTAQPVASQILCQNATPQLLTTAATGGSAATFTYQWYSSPTNSTANGIPIPGATNPTFDPPTTNVGTVYYYCVASQATSGCSVTSSVSVVTVNTSPSVMVQPLSSQVCLGGTIAALTFTTANGQGAATYQWFENTTNTNSGGTPIPGATTATYTPSSSADGIFYYYCAITFSGITGSCATISTQVATIIVTPGATISAEPMTSQQICVGSTLPSPLTVTYTGGTGTPTYMWYSTNSPNPSGGTAIGTNSSSFTPAVFTTPGIYYYYVSIQLSASGCAPVTSQIAQVTVVADPVVTAQPTASQTLCPNENATPLSVAVTGGIGTDYSYQWFQSPTPNGSGTPIPGETNPTITPPTNTTGTMYYYCIVSQATSASCNAQSEVAAVTVSPAPQISTQPASQTICSGQSVSALGFSVINGVGNATYQWFSNVTATNVGGSAISGATSATYVPDNDIVGDFYYYATVTFPDLAGNCSSVSTNAVQISINQNPIISNKTETICSGANFTITPTSEGSDIVPLATTFTWSSPTVSPSGSITGSSAQTLPQTNISQQLVNVTTSAATVTYNVTPLSGNCPGVPFQVVVTVNPAISPNVTVNDNLCFGANTASITTNVVGGIPFPTGSPYLYSWTGPNGFIATDANISNLAPGQYSVTIIDEGGCPFSDTYTISEPAQLEFLTSSETDVTCNGLSDGAISIAIIGGTPNYTFNWTKDTAPFSTSQNLIGLAPGNYEVTVSDQNACPAIMMTFTITEPQPLVASVSAQTNIECFGANTGALSVAVAGGTQIATNPNMYQFAWTGPNGFTSVDQNIADLIAGDYILTVTDANNCQTTLTATVTQNPEILITYTASEITCYGANDANLTVNLSGGIAPYSFVWSNMATILNQTNLAAGDYTITVTDALGCVKSLLINIPEAPIFTVNPVVTQISCHGEQDGSIALNLVGGIAPISLVWSDGSPAGLTRNNLSAGTYSVTITDGKPCVIQRSFVIVEPQPLVLSAQINNADDCNSSNGGAIDLLVAGGTPPYDYAWSNGSTSEDLTNLTNGNYTVEVTDSRGCVTNGQYSVLRPDPIAISVTTQTDFNCETHEVSQDFVASVTGGLPPYQLQWSSGTVSGVNNEIMHTTTNGIVMLTATDALGCSMQYSVNVDIPVLGYIDFDMDSYGNEHYGIFSIEDPIAFNSTITGDYETVVWDFGDGTFSSEVSPTHTYVNPGSYVVVQTVTYPFGCRYTKVITLIVEDGYFLTIPTAFTPNNDNLNDNYRPVSKRLEAIRLEIYDSWGSMIFSEMGNVLVGWDGTIKGAGAENGNYYCKVTARTFYGRTVSETRTFVLIK